MNFIAVQQVGIINKSEIQALLMNKYQSLESLLRSPGLQPHLFFQTQGIAQQINNNIDTFVKFCRTHPAFATSMLALALNTPYSLLQNPNIKMASHAATEVLCSEETAIAELFFEENMQAIPDESPLQDEEGIDQMRGELQRHQLATLSLQILLKPQSNETCLGYLQKLYSFLIRHNPVPVLNYFQTHSKQLQLLLNNLRYSSISSLVAQLLTSEDRTKAYKHEKFKRRIMEYVVESLFERAEDWDSFDGVMALVEEVFNTTKQSYYEYFEDFKRVSNLLVSQEVMQRFLDIILDRHEPSFRNASAFLELLFARINSEGEDNSYYHRGEETEPSMNFQVEVFFENMPAIIELVAHIENFQSLTKISYLSFLEGLFKCAKVRKYRFTLCQPAFIGLLDSLNRQSKAGVYKNKLYNLIAVIVESASAQEIDHFLQQNNTLWEKYFASIRSADYSNTKVYNMNESCAFDVAIINQMNKKDAKVADQASQAIGKDFKRICKKYQTKIASFHNNPYFSPEEEPTIQHFKPNKTGTVPVLTLDLINKNIVIALPNHAAQDQPQQSKETITEAPSVIAGIKEVQEIEEVIVVTDQIEKLALNGKVNNEQQPSQNISPTATTPLQNPRNEDKNTFLKDKQKIAGHADRVRFFTKHLSIFG